MDAVNIYICINRPCVNFLHLQMTLKRLCQLKLSFGKEGDRGQEEETESKRKREGGGGVRGKAGKIKLALCHKHKLT